MKTVETNALIQKKELINRIAIPTMEGYVFIPMNAIYYLKAAGNYTYIIYVTDETMKKMTASKKIGYFEEVLKDSSFLRIHDSYIANLTKAVKYFKGKDGSIQLVNGDYLPVSRTRKDELFSVFGI
ncbi:MAG: LytTR family transcriptional regulator [Tannerellaceae bacterium]|jgi:two-component system LytT family response regulator|nr:LytTR family transcriptional regulator [Tannerellaceae bacterium]